jgi:hypothetical protein
MLLLIIQEYKQAERQWLTPGILATGGKHQEDCFQGQPRQIVCDTLCRKNPMQNRAGGVAQVIGHLPSN